MGYRTLLLVRHADYIATTHFPDTPDGALTEKGRNQSACVAKRLQSLKLDVLHVSSMIRARETAQIIAAYCGNMPLRSNDILCECIPVVPQGFEQHFAIFPAEFIAKGPDSAQSAFSTYFIPLTAEEPDRTEVIVSHGNLIGYLVARALNAPVESWLRLDLGNCCTSEIRIFPSGFMKVIRHNDDGHLPPELRTEV